jgi:hypothetical protein
MDTHYIAQLLLSVAIFAPGVILLAGLAFVGLLMLLERTLLGAKTDQPAAQTEATVGPNGAGNPSAARIVAALKDAIEADGKPAETAQPVELRSTHKGRK